MPVEKLKYEKPQVVVEFDLIVSAGSEVQGNRFPGLDDPLNYESLGLGDPFDLAH